jgi:hypothetical protein
MAGLLRRIALAVSEVSIAHPRKALLLGGAAVLAASLGLRHLELRTDGKALVPPDDPTVRFDAEVREHFGLRDPLVVSIETDHPDGIYRPETARLVVELTAAIQALAGIEAERVVSLATESGTRVYPGTATPRPFLDPLPETPRQMENLRYNLEGIDILVGTLITEDRRGTAILVGVPPLPLGGRPSDDGSPVDRIALYRRVGELTDRFSRPGHRVEVVGAPAAEALLGTHVLEDLRLLLPLSIAVMAVVLWLGCRRFWVVALGLGEVAACLLFTFGSMGFLGVPIYLTTAVLPVILVTVGLADEIHVLWHYQRVLDRGGGHPRAVRITLGEMAQPVVLTSVTTAIGFASFLASPLAAVRVFGLFAPIGILFCLYWTLSVIPAALALLPPDALRHPTRSGATPWWGARLLAPLYRHRDATVAILAFLTLACGAGALRLIVQDSWLDGFAPRSPFRTATDRVNARYLGTHLLLAHLTVDPLEAEPRSIRFGAAGGLVMPANLRRIGAFEEFLRGQPGVGGALGPYAHLTTVSFLRHARRQEYRRIPEQPYQIDSLLRRFDTTRGQLRRREVIDDARRRAVVTIFLGDANYRESAELMLATRRWSEKNLEPYGIHLAFAGDVAVSQDLSVGEINLEHHPIATDQGPSDFDTVVYRPKSVEVSIGEQVSTSLRIVALSLQSVDYLTVSCDGVDRNYRVYVYLDNPQEDGLIWIRRDSANDGRYDATFDVLGSVKFEDQITEKIHGPIDDDVQVITTNNAAWAVEQGAFGTHPGTAITIDTDWDSIPDFTCPGEGEGLGGGVADKAEGGEDEAPNFFPGWKWNNGPKSEPVEHDGPHPEVCGATNCPPPWSPPQPCGADAFQVLSDFVVEGKGFDADGAALALNASRAETANSASLELSFAAVRRCISDVAVANQLLGIR